MKDSEPKNLHPFGRTMRILLVASLTVGLLGPGGDDRHGWEPKGRAFSASRDRETLQRSSPPLDYRDFFETLPGVLADIATDTLAEAIAYSRNRALTSSRPIPDRVRRALEPHFVPHLLDRVRYTTDWSASTDSTLQRWIMMNDHVQAVTLDDVIVFRDRNSSHDLFLWAHELTHVEQYERWGIQEFARRYLLDYREVEREAEEQAARIYRKLLEKHYSLPLEGRPKPP